MSGSAPADRPTPSVLVEATWYLRTGLVAHRTALIVTGEISLAGIKALLAEHYLGDRALADHVHVPYITLVHEQDLPGAHGASVVDPDTGAIRITSRTCTVCPYTGAVPAGFADALGVIAAHRGHQVCTATIGPDTEPGHAAICRGFATGPWQDSIALHLAATGTIDTVDPPPTPR